MKKIFRKSNILSFILGAVIFTGITSVAAYTILANDIGYTPKDRTWQVDNVKDAIDDLYTKSNTTISGLNNQISTLEGQVSTLTTQLANATNAGAYGEFTTSSAGTYTFNDIGFRPKKVIVYIPLSTTNMSYFLINDSENNKKEALYLPKTTSGAVSISSLNIIDTGFTLTVDSNALGKLYWYVFK